MPTATAQIGMSGRSDAGLGRTAEPGPGASDPATSPRTGAASSSSERLAIVMRRSVQVAHAWRQSGRIIGYVRASRQPSLGSRGRGRGVAGHRRARTSSVYDVPPAGPDACFEVLMEGPRVARLDALTS